jgi:hypothetical protein
MQTNVLFVCLIWQILIEFKTSRSMAASAPDIWNATILTVSDVPLLVADSSLQFEAIAGSLVNIPLQSNAFRSAQIEPFAAAPLAFAVMQWSTMLSASVAIIPIQKTV